MSGGLPEYSHAVTHARREVDLTDTMTNAKIDAFFGPLDLNLNAANSTRFTGNFELGKDNPKDTEGSAACLGTGKRGGSAAGAIKSRETRVR